MTDCPNLSRDASTALAFMLSFDGEPFALDELHGGIDGDQQRMQAALHELEAANVITFTSEDLWQPIDIITADD